jgi:hypothetical protein
MEETPIGRRFKRVERDGHGRWYEVIISDAWRGESVASGRSRSDDSERVTAFTPKKGAFSGIDSSLTAKLRSRRLFPGGWGLTARHNGSGPC